VQLQVSVSCGTKPGHPQPEQRDNVRAAANKLHRRRDSAINILPAGGERLSHSFAQRESLRRRRPAVHSNEARGRERAFLSRTHSPSPGELRAAFFQPRFAPESPAAAARARLTALDSNSATRFVDFGLLNCGEKQNKRAHRCSQLFSG
jgi:hypothetical protein